MSWQTFTKVKEEGSSPSSIVSLLLMHVQHVPTQQLHINTLTDMRLLGQAGSGQWDWPRKPFFIAEPL